MEGLHHSEKQAYIFVKELYIQRMRSRITYCKDKYYYQIFALVAGKELNVSLIYNLHVWWLHDSENTTYSMFCPRHITT